MPAAVPAVHVKLTAIEKTFPAKGGRPPVHALGPIDLEIGAGEFLAVVGPSGCGKSTLFEIIAGIATATGGSVEFEGKPVRGQVPDGVGVVFQEDACLPWLTVGQNIEFGFLGKSVPREEQRRRFDWVIELTGLRDFVKSYPSHLSGGMRQRVCIARTLVMQPRLILLDEPFAALDQQTRLIMGEEVLRLWRQTDATVFLITHALDEATMLADRIAVMSARPGRLVDIVKTGWPRERDSTIIERPEFGAVTARLWKSLRHEVTPAAKI
jgi:NitT/TauT family transport system ATP-binding protein